MKNRKKKSFYSNKHRNEKWTEQPQGREIDFADKYAYTAGYSDKYDETTRSAHQAALRKKENNKKHLQRAFAFVMAVVLIGVGYIVTDAHIIRSSKPVEALLREDSNSIGTMSQLEIRLNAISVDPISLDNSSMLDSIITDVRDIGLNSICFDAKRVDGTIGYKSSLATIDTYGALSNYASEPVKSIKKLLENDILPVARICCYMDNVVPYQAEHLAMKKNGKIYKDEDGNTYLDPSNIQNYNYIRDIVTELYDCGITVFVLCGCNIPNELSSNDDGFKAIAQKLSASLSGEVKFVEETQVNLNNGSFYDDSENSNLNNSKIKKRISELKDTNGNQVYYIISDIDERELSAMINETKSLSYIIS